MCEFVRVLALCRATLPQFAHISHDIVLVAGDKMHDGVSRERVDVLMGEVEEYRKQFNLTMVMYHSAGGKHTVASGGYTSPPRRYWNKWARWCGVNYVKDRDR